MVVDTPLGAETRVVTWRVFAVNKYRVGVLLRKLFSIASLSRRSDVSPGAMKCEWADARTERRRRRIMYQLYSDKLIQD